MRTKTILLTAALAAAGIAASKAQTVYSVNSVGFVNVPLTTGYNLFSNPLNSTNNSIQSLLTTLPNGTLLLTWNSGIQDFNNDTFFTGAGWFNGDGDSSTTVIPPGSGAFVQVAGANNILFVGEVMQGSLTNTIPSGLQIVSSQVPQAGTPTQLSLTNVSNGGALLKFNTAIQDYNTFTYFTGSGWFNEDGDPIEPVINVGEAVFVNFAGTTLWKRTFSVNN